MWNMILEILWNDKWHGIPIPFAGLFATVGSYFASLNLEGVLEIGVLFFGCLVGMLSVLHGFQKLAINRELLRKAKKELENLRDEEGEDK